MHSLNLDTLERMKEQHRIRGQPGTATRDDHTRARADQPELRGVLRKRPIFFDGCNLDDASIPVESYIAQFLDNSLPRYSARLVQGATPRTLRHRCVTRPFPHHRGYDILQGAGHRLLVLGCESPDDIKRFAVDSFLGIHLEDLVRTNIGDEKTTVRYTNASRNKSACPRKAALPSAFMSPSP
ncbi:MAG: hypothetical protein ACREWE_13735 [Gammaproteobacteria bacterium]